MIAAAPAGPNKGRLKLRYQSPLAITCAPGNARRHPASQIAAIWKSIQRFGFNSPILVDANNQIIAGHGRHAAAIENNIDRVPTAAITDLSAAQIAAYRLADNRLAEMSEWDSAMLDSELGALTDIDDIAALGFDDPAPIEPDVLPKRRQRRPPKDPPRENDLAPPPAGVSRTAAESISIARPETEPAEITEALVKPGDIWELGDHRLMCGDSTIAADVDMLFGAVSPDLIIAVPPKAAETRRAPDKPPASGEPALTHHGYTAAVRAMLGNLAGAKWAYIFTDWQLWSYLTAAAELEGMLARMMIVWDPLKPVAGRQWLAQHNLILWAEREKYPCDKFARPVGNVLKVARETSGKAALEAPVALLLTLIENTPKAAIIADPMSRRGSTLIAAEQCGRKCMSMERTPRRCDAILDRWSAFGGAAPRKLTAGEVR